MEVANWQAWVRESDTGINEPLIDGRCPPYHGWPDGRAEEKHDMDTFPSCKERLEDTGQLVISKVLTS
jgi:hypothetical protein